MDHQKAIISAKVKVIVANGSLWLTARPIAEAMGSLGGLQFIEKRISPNDIVPYDKITRIEDIEVLHPKTKLISKNGLVELLEKRDANLLQWMLTEFLPTVKLNEKSYEEIIGEPITKTIDNIVWILAEPLVRGFESNDGNCRELIAAKVSYDNQMEMESSIYININGVFEYVSQVPNADQIKRWLIDEFLPKVPSCGLLLAPLIEETNEVLSVIIDDVMWVSAKPIAKLFGYVNCDQAIKNHVNAANQLMSPLHMRGRLINEAGMYQLIMKSKKPNAKQFKKWVNGTLLPRLRKYGRYSLHDAPLTIQNEMNVISKCFNNTSLSNLTQSIDTTPTPQHYDEIIGEMIKFTIDNILWMMAKPFAKALGYSDCEQAVRELISEENRIRYKKIKEILKFPEGGNGRISSQTVFINEAGLYELINNSKKPNAKEFQEWITNELLPKWRNNQDYDMIEAPQNVKDQMDLISITVGDKALVAQELTVAVPTSTGQNYDYIIDEIIKFNINGTLWMIAKPFAKALGYANCEQAIRELISEENRIDYKKIKSAIKNNFDDSLKKKKISSQTVFINEAGLYELINSSRKPNAKAFQEWITNELLPKLQQGSKECDMTDAPPIIQYQMQQISSILDENESENLKYLKVQMDRMMDMITRLEVAQSRNSQIVEEVVKKQDYYMLSMQEHADKFVNAIVHQNRIVDTLQNAIVEQEHRIKNSLVQQEQSFLNIQRAFWQEQNIGKHFTNIENEFVNVQKSLVRQEQSISKQFTNIENEFVNVQNSLVRQEQSVQKEFTTFGQEIRNIQNSLVRQEQSVQKEFTTFGQAIGNIQNSLVRQEQSVQKEFTTFGQAIGNIQNSLVRQEQSVRKEFTTFGQEIGNIQNSLIQQDNNIVAQFANIQNSLVYRENNIKQHFTNIVNECGHQMMGIQNAFLHQSNEIQNTLSQQFGTIQNTIIQQDINSRQQLTGVYNQLTQLQGQISNIQPLVAAEPNNRSRFQCIEIHVKAIDDPYMYDDNRKMYCYHTLRTQRCSLESARAAIQPGFRRFYYSECANAINAFNCIKERIKYNRELSGHNKIFCHHNEDEFMRAVEGAYLNGPRQQSITSYMQR